MEEKLRLQKQLEIIRLQKQKLQETAKKWDLVYKLGKSSEVIQEKLSLVKDKEIATSPLFNNDSHCSDVIILHSFINSYNCCESSMNGK